MVHNANLYSGFEGKIFRSPEYEIQDVLYVIVVTNTVCFILIGNTSSRHLVHCTHDCHILREEVEHAVLRLQNLL